MRTIKLHTNIKILAAVLLVGFILFNFIQIGYAQDILFGPEAEEQMEKTKAEKTGEPEVGKVERIECAWGDPLYTPDGKPVGCLVPPIKVHWDTTGKILMIDCPSGSQPYYEKKSDTSIWEGIKGFFTGENVKNKGCIAGASKTIREEVKTAPMKGISYKGYETSVEIPCQPIFGGKCPTTATPAGYIARLYQFGLMIAGLAAFGAIVFGALKYILSAGNIANQQDARDQITQAIIGLALLLGAYIILYTINPELVNLRNPRAEIIDVEKIRLAQEQGLYVPGEQEELPTDTGAPPLIEGCKLAMQGKIVIQGKEKIGLNCFKCIEGYELYEDKSIGEGAWRCRTKLEWEEWEKGWE